MNQMSSHTVPVILLFSSDLMMISTLSSAAAAEGIVLRTASSSNDVSGNKELEKVSLVIVDLENMREAIDTLVANVLAQLPDVRIVAFGPHVRTADLQRAALAGCHQVMPRGQFLAQFSTILNMARVR